MATSPRPTSRVAVLALGLALALALGAAAPARAQPAAGTAAEAREAFLTGEAYYRKGDFKEAIAHYQRAYESKPHPAVLYNIGECWERLGHFDHAAELYERYLRDLPTARDRAKVAGKLTRFRALPARVSVSSSPAGALVVIDGHSRGRTPLIVELAPGDHDLEATYRDRGAQRRQIQCAFGRPQFVSFAFGARAGRLVVRTSIEGVELKLDGEVVGYTPYESDVAPGRHVLELTLYGYEPVRRDVAVVAGTTNQVVERMRRLGGADQVDVRRDGETPFAPVAAGGPRPGVQQPGTRPPVQAARYTIGGFGGAWAVRSVQDTPGMGGVSVGIHGGSRIADLALDVAFPSPVVLDTYVRYYFGQAIFRPFVKVGLIIGFTPSKQSGSSGASDARYGLSLAGGFALDVGSSLVLYVQAGVNMVGSGGSSSSGGDGTTGTGTTATGTSQWLQIPVTGGLYFKL